MRILGRVSLLVTGVLFLTFPITASLCGTEHHLVLKSGQRTLVAEIPHPDSLDDTPESLKTMIIQDFDESFAVGMFDKLGHAEGTSPNGIELHRVIKIAFLH